VVVRVVGTARRLPLGALRVHVRSVLPTDSAQRVPKPARAPVPDYGLWWLRLALLALAVLAVIALLVWARGAGTVGAGPRSCPTMPTATRWQGSSGSTAWRSSGAGEPGRHVALAVEVLRDYLAARLPEARASHTSGELSPRSCARQVPHDRLDRVLGVADLVKFAALPIGGDAALDTAREARALVDEVERGTRAREQREAEETARREAAERAEQRRYEEARRRAARAAKREGRSAPRDRERAA
jgi:hypothetical protein